MPCAGAGDLGDFRCAAPLKEAADFFLDEETMKRSLPGNVYEAYMEARAALAAYWDALTQVRPLQACRAVGGRQGARERAAGTGRDDVMAPS